MQRLESQEPFYKISQWKEQRKDNVKYLISISKFPELYDPKVLPALSEGTGTQYAGTSTRGVPRLPGVPSPFQARKGKQAHGAAAGPKSHVTPAGRVAV